MDEKMEAKFDDAVRVNTTDVKRHESIASRLWTLQLLQRSLSSLMRLSLSDACTPHLNLNRQPRTAIKVAAHHTQLLR